jgi:tetratricopeptide (TPR) repeat protein
MTSEHPSADNDFGQRVRERRRQLGRSQTELAGTRLSASYLSLLEAGKRRPTPDVVTALAAALDCTPDYLMHGHDPKLREKFQLGVRYAELAIRNGEAADALTTLDTLLDDVAHIADELVRAAKRARARALESAGRLADTIDVLEVLHAQARADERAEEHLGLTIDLVRCYREAGDIARALDLGVDALDTVGSLGLTGTDVHAELVSTVIGVYYERGDLVTAGRLAESALRDVDDRGTPRARAAVYWNASLVAEAADDVSTAVLLAERALALYADGDDERSLARLRVAYGWLLLRTSPPQPETARDMLQVARAALADVGTATDVAYCETELARAALMLGDPERALEHAGRAKDQLSAEARLESAFVHLVRGAALLALERHDEAVAEYRQASSTLGSLDVARQAAGAWRELADAFTRLDLLRDAALAYQQALSEVGVRGAPQLTDAGATSAKQSAGTMSG